MCGGIGAFLGIDVTFVRIAFVLITLASGVGVGVMAYVAMWAIIPPEEAESEANPRAKSLAVGVAFLVAVSLAVAAMNSNVLPLVLIAGGAGLIIYSRRSRQEATAPSEPPATPIDLEAEAEAAWCRSFNMAMASKGDPTRIHPGDTICPHCGTVTQRGRFCGHCGARIEVSREAPR